MVTKKTNNVKNIATDLLNFHRLTPEKWPSRDSAISNLSNLEEKILRAKEPIRITESEEIELNSIKGLWLNKSEVKNWSGIIPLSEYIINQDDDPLIIKKQPYKDLKYMREIVIRYLR